MTDNWTLTGEPLLARFLDYMENGCVRAGYYVTKIPSISRRLNVK